MANNLYKTGVGEEYIILGNDALIKCNVPSFVSDFVSVDSWEDSEGVQIFHDDNIGNYSQVHNYRKQCKSIQRKPHPGLVLV